MIYLFTCLDCNRMFDKVMSVTAYSATSIFSCPYCKSIDTARVYNIPPAVIYKDSDFTLHKGNED